MAVRPILRLGHPTLREIAAPVPAFDTPDLHALVLERDVDRAKVLAYTMERIRTRLAAERLSARCTAVVEARPESETAELSARILAEQDIAFVPAADLADFTSWLRQELA